MTNTRRTLRLRVVGYRPLVGRMRDLGYGLGTQLHLRDGLHCQLLPLRPTIVKRRQDRDSNIPQPPLYNVLGCLAGGGR